MEQDLQVTPPTTPALPLLAKLGQFSPLKAFGNSRRVAQRLGNVSDKHSAKGTEGEFQGSSKDINLHTQDEDPRSKK